jgi:hypothetical protein
VASSPCFRAQGQPEYGRPVPRPSFERWGILTIGTGLGNASFVNRKADVRDQ